MRAAEIFLRVGVILVGWIVCYAHTLMLAVIPQADCSLTNPGLWEPTMMLTPLTLIAIATLGAGAFIRDTAKWLTVPLIFLIGLAAISVAPFLTHTTLNAAPACALINPDFQADVTPLWQRLWAPLQLLVLTGMVWRIYRYWRS